MAGSYWSSQHCKAVVEVNSALRARERGACDTATVISRINSSSCISADERGQVLKFMSDVAHSLQLSKSEAFHTFCFDRVIGTACVYVNRFCCATKKLRSTLALLSLSCFCLAVKVDEVPHLSNSMIVAVAQPSIQKCFPNVAVAQPSIQKCFPNAASIPEIATGDVEKMEAELMQQLDFELIVHHPFRIMSYLASATGSSHMLNNANAILRDSYQTCMLLVFPPAVLALAALAASCALAGESIAGRFAVCGVDTSSIMAVCTELLSMYDREQAGEDM